MEKPKTYMLRLYPDKAADQILIQYLKGKRNIQQYLKQLIEKDLEHKSIVKTIREIMEEYLQSNEQKDTMAHLNEETESILIKPIDEEKFVEKKEDCVLSIPDSVEDQEEDVEKITPEALEFLKGLGQ